MHCFRLLCCFFVFFYQCAIFQKSSKEHNVNFDYSAISKNYFYSNQTKPFPLTVQTGNNLYNSTTQDGRYLFYATDQKGSFDIWFRDLKSSVVVPVTNHPYSESKPSISPDGSKLIFVSEEFDSEGDLILLKMDLEEWKQELLKGNRYINEDYINLTNPNFKKENFKQGIIDTDPVWAPDGRYIVFVSDRFSPGLPNLCKLNIENPKDIIQISKAGASSPSFSSDGKFIYYISYLESDKGEIYRINVDTLEPERITKNDFLDYSPTVDKSNQNIYYSSIRKDTNKNGRLDERDNSILVKRNLSSGQERNLSSGETSNFDTRYSNFNGGSILFSASYYNSINIYFIPENGSIPKQPNIAEQYVFAKSFITNNSSDAYFLALDSIELFYSDDPLFPIYNAKITVLKYDALRRMGKREDANKLLRSLISAKEDQNSLFGIALGKFEESRNGNTKFDLEFYLKNSTSKVWSLDSIPSLYHLLADDYENKRSTLKAFELLKKIESEYPNYHQIAEIRRRIGGYEFTANSNQLPVTYTEMINSWNVEKENFEKYTALPFPLEKKRDLRYLLEDVIQKIPEGKNSRETIQRLNSLLADPQNTDNIIFRNTLVFLKAKAHSEFREFNESNALLDSIIPIPLDIDLEPPGKPSVFETPKYMAEYKNPLLLRANLLKYFNQKSLGNTSDALRNLKIYLEFYDPMLGVNLNSEEIQNAFFYFENKAIEFERIGDLLQSSFHYFFNNQNMFLVKTRNLYLDSLYKDYAVYYQRKMVDTIFSYGKKIREDEERAIFNQLNILGKDKLNVVGNISDVTGILTNSELFRGVIDVKDFEKIEVLSEKALSWTELYYKQAVPRARPYLDLATLYGYAYFLINKYVIYETYYNSTGTMTDVRKNEILENYKKAEMELRWIIYADPTYYDAYQLLGWLYQYVDLMKQRVDKRSGKYEIELYEVLYKKYFPDKNLEENIELYSQILTFLGSDYGDKKVISDLNLNLGNNYFLLNNYPKSNESYELVASASEYLLAKNQFESFKQEAVYRFNYGRSLIYQGRYKDAVTQFDKAIDIYFNREYIQAVNANASEPNAINKQKLDEVRSKLALLFALKGFSELEDGNYEKSSSSFQTSIAYNKGVKFINPISLYNYLAIVFQKNGRFRDSYSMLDAAENEYKNIKFSPIEYFKKASFWNVLLKDNVRVMGEGRFPGEFPDDFKFLLTLGVRIENHIEQKEYDFALREIEERNQFIYSKSLDKMIMGRNILAKSKQIEAQVYFQSGNTLKSIELYSELIQLLLKEKQEKGIERLFQSLSRSVFVFIEDEENSIEDKLFRATNFITLLKKWRTDFNQDCKQSDSECDYEFRSKYVQYDILLGTIYYYFSELFYQQDNSEESRKYLVFAIECLENPGLVDPKIIGLSNDPISKKNRIRILTNLFLIYSKLGDVTLAERRWKDAYELAFEFRMEEEIFWLKSQKFRSELESNSFVIKKTTENLGIEAYNTFKSNVALRLFTNRERVKKLLNDVSYLYLETKKEKEVVNLWEDFRRLELFRDVFGAQFEFEDTKLNLAYKDILIWQKNYRKLVEAVAEKGLRRENISKILQQKSKEEAKFQTLLEKIQALNPDKRMFFQPISNYTNAFFQGWIGVYRYKNNLYSFGDPSLKLNVSNCPLESLTTNCLFPENHSTLEIQILGNDFDGRLVQKIISTYRESGKQVSILFDRDNHNLFTERNERKLKWVTYFGATNERIKNDNVRLIGESDLGVLLFDTDYLLSKRKLYGKGSLFSDKISEIVPLREIFSSSGSEISLVGFPIANFESKHQWNQLNKIYEVLRSKRIQNVISFDGNQNIDSITQNLNLTSFANSKDQFFLGSFTPEINSENNINQRIYNLQQLGYEKEKTKELPEAYEYYYTASTLLHDTHPDLPNVELKMAKLKADIFPNIPRVQFFEPLWRKYKNSPIQNYIRYEFLVSCYSSKELEKCDEYDSGFVGESREAYINAVLFYKKLRNSQVSDLKKLNIERTKVEGNEDPFLQAYRLGSLYIQNFMFFEAEEETNKMRRLAKSAKEKNVVKNRDLEIFFHKGFLSGDKSVYTTSLTSTSAYSYGFRNEWDLYEEKIQSREFTKFGYSDSIYDSYRLNLYTGWRDLIQVGNIEPLLLTPEFLTTGESVLTKLSHLNRSLLFHMLVSSIPNQKSDEVNSLIELLIQEEKREGRNFRILAFRLMQVKALLLRGENEMAEKFLLNFENENSKLGLGNTYLNEQYRDVKNKYSYLLDKPVMNSELSGFESYYQLAKSSKPEAYLNIINDIQKKYKNEYLSPELKAEYEFLFSYLLKLSLKNNSSETFFDVAVARDLFRYHSDRYLGKKVFVKDLPLFKNYSNDLKQKMIGNQELNAIFDLGKKTYLLSFSGGKSLGRELFSDNKEIFRDIFKYQSSIFRGGSETLLRESIADRYRTNLRLAKNKRHYLYLHGFHEYIPLQLPDTEYYHVSSVQSLVSNPAIKKSSWTNKSFVPSILNAESEPESKISAELLLWELQNSKGNNLPVTLDFSEISFDKKFILYHGISLFGLSSKYKRQNSVYANQKLGLKYIMDFSPLSYFLSLENSGFFIVHSGKQEGIHNLIFMKKLLEESEIPKPINIRVQEGKEAARIQAVDDRYWTGYRLFTNCMVED